MLLYTIIYYSMLKCTTVAASISKRSWTRTQSGFRLASARFSSWICLLYHLSCIPNNMTLCLHRPAMISTIFMTLIQLHNQMSKWAWPWPGSHHHNEHRFISASVSGVQLFLPPLQFAIFGNCSNGTTNFRKMQPP